ncbi:hypothetical protein VTN96DRAFT_8228 [Rasamsonia emersonii]|uniref:Uncharacterized protein n=1 Tax=Rasamsonia emersonii (strain ATCC 16479 / CBS 393.64 / IMI 116815) TaxID=1408163 RepID=A0A0F4YLD0_RASE3|nr:hypothetical protein T310_7391 [Rasamsonia emersonii CBS 393.64]KKA18646.1 hypothetical protein T310_7391 [Rasamsonia emersonii CBS 393.64]
MSVPPRPKPSPKPSSQRLPPPSLFQGPPSHNASNVSLSVAGGPQRPPFVRSRSRRSAASSEANRSLSPFISRTQSQGEADSAEILWQEMQNTLAEVELSAVHGEHVFGEEHSKALDELRTKQLKLAQAWARSEVDEVVEDQNAEEQNQPAAKSGGQPGSGRMAETGADSTATYRALEAETEKDLQHARKRREANDRYFDRVNSSVLDVVARLEEVAQAMRAVERESKDIWSDTTSESVNTTAASTNG